MSKNTQPKPLRATTGDVAWLDQHHDAMICGFHFTKADVVMAEPPGDRKPNGLLTVEAKQRIAEMLTGDIRRREERAFADRRAKNQGTEPQIRNCEG